MHSPETDFKQAVARSFSKAAEHYESLALIQWRLAEQLLVRVGADPVAHILDAGCGAGWLTRRLAAREGVVRVSGLDLAAGMLEQARRLATPETDVVDWILADMEHLPLASESQDLVVSNLAMQWLPSPRRFFQEVRRVLRPGGRLLCTTLLPGTLGELHHAWATVDARRHVNAFLPAETVHEAAVEAGLQGRFEGVRERVYYPDVASALRSIKGIGASTLNTGGSRVGLGGRRSLAAMMAAYEALREPPGIPVTYHVLTGEVRR